MMMLEDLIAQNPALFKKEYNHFYRRGSYLLHQGEPLQSLFFILKGSGIVGCVDEDGGERVLHYFHRGDCAGKAALYRERGNSPIFEGASIVAMTDCLCYKVPLEECVNYAQQHAGVFRYLMEVLVREVGRLEENLMLMRENKTAAVLCRFFQDNAYDQKGVLALDRWFNYEELSRILGIHSVTISRMVRRLMEEGVVAREPHRFLILQPAALESYAAGKQPLHYL